MIKPYVRRGSRPGDETYYLHIPREFVRALGITPDDIFELTIKTKNKVKLNQSFFSNPLYESVKPKTVVREL